VEKSNVQMEEEGEVWGRECNTEGRK